MVPGERREGERLAEARLVVRKSFVDEETYETSHEPRSKTLRSSWFIYWNLSDYTNYRYIQQIMDMNCSFIVVEWDSMLI